MCSLVQVQAALEALSPGIDYDKLEGLWEVIYTTAPDVVRIWSLWPPAQDASPALLEMPAITGLTEAHCDSLKSLPSLPIPLDGRKLSKPCLQSLSQNAC